MSSGLRRTRRTQPSAAAPPRLRKRTGCRGRVSPSPPFIILPTLPGPRQSSHRHHAVSTKRQRTPIDQSFPRVFPLFSSQEVIQLRQDNLRLGMEVQGVRDTDSDIICKQQERIRALEEEVKAVRTRMESMQARRMSAEDLASRRRGGVRGKRVLELPLRPAQCSVRPLIACLTDFLASCCQYAVRGAKLSVTQGAPPYLSFAGHGHDLTRQVSYQIAFVLRACSLPPALPQPSAGCRRPVCHCRRSRASCCYDDDAAAPLRLLLLILSSAASCRKCSSH